MSTAPVPKPVIDPTRLAAIMALPEAKGLEQSAYRLAQGTGTVEQVRQDLAGMHRAAAQARRIATDALWNDVIDEHNAQAGMPVPAAGCTRTAPANPLQPKPPSPSKMWDEVIGDLNRQHGRLG